MDYVWFALIVLALIGAWMLVNRIDRRAKERYRRDAYRILDKKEVKDTLRGLSLYGGRLKKDKEFDELKKRLYRKLGGRPLFD